jgi:hypothetical protein
MGSGAPERVHQVLPDTRARWQRQLLSFYASTLRSRDLIPLLESVLDGWKPGDYYEAPHEALASLYELDPARAQARIVAELKKDRTWLDASQLALLPPGAARITDDELIAALAAAQRPGGWNVGNSHDGAGEVRHSQGAAARQGDLRIAAGIPASRS